MKTPTRIRQISKKASQMEKDIKQIVQEIDDYDLKRLLKKIDAECLDVRHNLALAERLLEAHHREQQRSKKAKRS
jgi:predicted DNA binding CopG/RHH family protein